ncbi:MAG: ABC transporter substrate-binding protein [Thiovulaceae bacterium]|nr:ABC transporter substrate-binding protein [Sulfurimonadaceae bacterium]MDD3817660.1 ABC transporter substrate-binding protein [Sulfurimonadaceae bacterium]
MRTVLFFMLLGMSLFVHAKQITDDYGRVVTVPDSVSKIYAASPPLTMSLLAFNPDLIAALNTPYRPEQKPYAGSSYTKPVAGGFFGQGNTPNFEVLAASKPEVIIMWARMNGYEKALAKFEKLGIPVLLVRNDSIKDLVSQFRLYGMLSGDKARADALIAYTQETLSLIDSLQPKIAKLKPTRYYFAQGVDGLFSECEGSFHLEPFSYSGGVNALDCKMSSNYGMEKMSMESVMLANPDVVIAMESSFAKSVMQDLRWKNLQAVQEKRVYLVPSTPFNFITRPPSFMRLMGIRWLIHTLYPGVLQGSLEDEQKKFDALFFKASNLK